MNTATGNFLEVEADLTFPAGTHSRKLTFDDVKAKGVVDLSIAPTRNYDWVVN